MILWFCLFQHTRGGSSDSPRIEIGRCKCSEMGTKSSPGQWIPYDQWKAEELNRLFNEQGVLHEPARITAETVKDGIKKELAESDRKRNG